MANSFSLVFSNFRYLVVAVVIFKSMLIPLSFVSEFLFFEPFVIWYIPSDRIVSFTLILAVSALSGIVISMNIYRVRLLTVKTRKIGGSLLGSLIGASAGACSCGPIGFTVITTFGTAGSVATSFLTEYEIPLRLGSIIILLIVLYTTSRSLSIECKIKN